MDNNHKQHGNFPQPAHAVHQPSQEHLLNRVREMEREIDVLRSEREIHAPPAPHVHTHHHDVIVSPLILSPSSMPPNTETETHMRSVPKPEDEFIEQLRIRDQKIESLEKNLALYQKKLKQTEELLYELQWDPEQDLVFSRLEDKSSLEIKYEKKISQLLDQMRVMERGLAEKQQTIDELTGQKRTHFNLVNSTEGAIRSPEDVDKYLNPLKGLIIDEPQTQKDPRIMRRRNSASNSPSFPSPSSSSWLSYIPFWGDKQQATL